MQWEAEFLLWLEQFRNPTFNLFWIGISYVGLGVLCIPVILKIIKKNERLDAITVIVTAGISFLLFGVIIKAMVHRARPFETWDMIQPLVYPLDTSFPSGHTLFSFTLAFFYIKFFSKRVGLSCLLLAFLVALSRLMLGVHYPTDVFAGFALAWISCEVGIRLLLPRMNVIADKLNINVLK